MMPTMTMTGDDSNSQNINWRVVPPMATFVHLCEWQPQSFLQASSDSEPLADELLTERFVRRPTIPWFLTYGVVNRDDIFDGCLLAILR